MAEELNYPELELPPVQPEEDTKQYPFRKSVGTYIVLGFLIFLFPGVNLLVAVLGGNEMDFGSLDPILFIFLPTVLMLWAIVLIVLLALWREKSNLTSIGMGLPTLTHVGIGILFFIGSSIVLMLLQLIITALGIPFSNNTDQILEIAVDHMWWWLIISITAAFCEEIIYRGYLMTRVKGLTRSGWAIPIIASTLAFASGHFYQGIGGAIVIGTYGLLFCGLYIMTGSIWPGIIAHFIQDYSAVFLFKLGKELGL